MANILGAITLLALTIMYIMELTNPCVAQTIQGTRVLTRLCSGTVKAANRSFSAVQGTEVRVNAPDVTALAFRPAYHLALSCITVSLVALFVTCVGAGLTSCTGSRSAVSTILKIVKVFCKSLMSPERDICLGSHHQTLSSQPIAR